MKKRTASPLSNRLAYFEQQKDSIVSTIRELVEIESPSDIKAATDGIASVIAEEIPGFGRDVALPQK